MVVERGVVGDLVVFFDDDGVGFDVEFLCGLFVFEVC